MASVVQRKYEYEGMFRVDLKQVVGVEDVTAYQRYDGIPIRVDCYEQKTCLG